VYGVLPKEATGASFLKCIEAVRQNQHWVSDETPASGATEEAAGAPEPRAGGGYGLTPRELQIIARVVNGASNKDICAQLSISLDTVKHHLASIFDKAGVGSRLELAIFALYHGIAFFD
jgi:DNA-binding NarL/FixJ family response regulator